MKKSLNTVLLGGLIICYVSCKKNTEQTIKITVTEYKTNTAIPDAIISFYKNVDFDPACLCWSGELFLTKQTDADGICNVSQTDYNMAGYQIDLSKPGYINLILAKNQNVCEMDVARQVSLHLIKTKSYPDGSFFVLYCNGERVSSKETVSLFVPPIDSSFVFTAYGNQNNTISWKIFPEPNSVAAIDSGYRKTDVPKSGITNVEISY
jgi:hypothetical protein